ncbi:MAG: class I SAM-dependent methyltransferase family protein [Candidatus Omnitrophica bacterium]|nr:class I SAM-dependent methyltransferase family protein [Candidatus Omnitrophota bacterium]
MSDKFESKRWPYYLILPITWLLTLWTIAKKKTNALLRKKKDVGLLVFDGIGKYGDVVKKNATGWKAVDLIYNHSFRQNISLGGLLDDFWFESLNCQAARNRFKLAKRELENAVIKFPKKQEIRVVSLAAGTGQIESEAIAKLKSKGFNVCARLVDKEEDALSRAKEYVVLNKVQDKIKLINSDVGSAIDLIKEFNPHIVKMIAFLDYLPEEVAIKFISNIYSTMPQGGVFIVSNTMPNIEMHFVKWVVGWPLIYRRPKEIANIITKSGFVKHNIVTEPLNIQGIIVAEKT